MTKSRCSIHRKGLVVVAPLPDERFRIVATVDEAPEIPSLDFSAGGARRAWPYDQSGRIREVAWSSRFHIHHRVARGPAQGPRPPLRRRRACSQSGGRPGHEHRHSRQRLLAEALTETLADGESRGSMPGLRSVTRSRADVVALTDRMTRMATMKSPTGKVLRNVAVMLAGHLPPVRAAVARTLAELV